MLRPNPPPTPAASSEIRGKEGSFSSAGQINLPPTAYQDPDRASISSNTPSNAGSDSSYRPMSPAYAPADARKRSAPTNGGVVTKDDFALPPPPTRSRKIIQMKPRDPEAQATQPAAAPEPAQTKAQGGAQMGTKRKQNSQNTTAAGRKIARKTAHSLIERKRRSKMNEEFGVLKDMIPACNGQDMHKLAILQASIEYLRYLEQCVADLQSQNSSQRPQPLPTQRTLQQEEEEDEDEEMEDDDEPGEETSTPVTQGPQKSGSIVSLPSLSTITTTSTLASPSNFSEAGRHYSISSASQASYSPYFHSNNTSPAFGPQLSHVSTAPQFSTAFGLGSPALKPVDSSVNHLRQIAEGASDLNERQRLAKKTGRSEHELDQEATAALLMLNNDRRQWRSGQEGQTQSPRTNPKSNTGMSVRDLLSG